MSCFARALLDAFENCLSIESERSGEHQFPAGRDAFESFHQAGDILAALDRADEENHLLAIFRRRVRWRGAGAMGDHSDSRWVHFQKVLQLPGSEVRDRDDEIRSLGSRSGLGSESGAELGGGIVAAEYEQIVEGGNCAAVVNRFDALVQAMEEIGGAGPVVPQETPAAVRRQIQREGRKKPVRPVAIEEFRFRMTRREAIQNFAGVYAHSRQIPAQAIGGIQGDFQSASITVLARRWVWWSKSPP